MIEVHHASLRYQDNIIFDNLQFTIATQQWTAILGPSGVGKTSLLKLLAGLLSESADCHIKLAMQKALCLTKDIAYLPQEDLLLPWLTVFDHLLIGPKLRETTRNKKALLQRADDLLTKVNLSQAKALYPHQLSGGMRQRLALAQLLIQEKPIILMDEPFKSLDAMTRFHLQSLFTALLHDKTVIFITHDLQEAARLAHQIYFMHGRPANLTLAATLKGPIPRDLTASTVIDTQAALYPLWKNTE